MTQGQFEWKPDDFIATLQINEKCNEHHISFRAFISRLHMLQNRHDRYKSIVIIAIYDKMIWHTFWITLHRGNCSFFELILLSYYTPEAYWFTHASYAEGFAWKCILSKMNQIIFIFNEEDEYYSMGYSKWWRKTLNWDFRITLHITLARNLQCTIE